MVDTPAPKESPRVAANLILRAALLLAPDREASAYLTEIVTAGRKLVRRVDEADEHAIIRSLVVALDQGVTHDNWQR